MSAAYRDAEEFIPELEIGYFMCTPEALEILGFGYQDTPSPSEIQDAFHRLAAVHHPDRGGDGDQMRRLLEARDLLMPRAQRTSAAATRSANRRARTLKNPDTRAIQEFSRLAKVDLASCWLALPKIKEWGLSLDHPRAAKIARGEHNRAIRAEWPGGMSFDSAEMLAASAGGSGDAELEDLAEKCRGAVADETFAPGQIDDGGADGQISRMMRLKNAVKPRDRETLELRFERGLNIAEIAAEVGKTPSAIYARFDRMKPILRAARERADWEEEHNGMLLAHGNAPAPVVLSKNGQLGWDLLDAEVQP